MPPDFVVLVVCVLLILGAVFVFLAALGVLRLPDFYTRTHAASKAGVVGGGLILLALAIMSQDSAIAVRAVIGVVFLLLTTPVAVHLLAKASQSSGMNPVNSEKFGKNTGNSKSNSAP